MPLHSCQAYNKAVARFHNHLHSTQNTGEIGPVGLVANIVVGPLQIHRGGSKSGLHVPWPEQTNVLLFVGQTGIAQSDEVQPVEQFHIVPPCPSSTHTP